MRDPSGKAAADDTSSETKSGQNGESGSGDKQEGAKEEEETKKDQQKKEDAPTPPHGNKSPWQVFTETLQSEFKASKEWNESTKAIASSAQELTQNETLKRARSAYGSVADVTTSTTSKAFKTTGKAIGQSAAWAWDTTPVKGLRAGASATGKGLEKVTRPVRETQTFQSMREVIDDGSSSRYGGWVEKEQRKKIREARELKEAARTGRPVRKAEKIEEDLE